MSVVINKVIGNKPSWIHNFILKQYDIIKIATLTLEMYCGLRFQISGLIITREIDTLNY
jgi:hypothetical protein